MRRKYLRIEILKFNGTVQNVSVASGRFGGQHETIIGRQEATLKFGSSKKSPLRTLTCFFYHLLKSPSLTILLMPTTGTISVIERLHIIPALLLTIIHLWNRNGLLVTKFLSFRLCSVSKNHKMVFFFIYNLIRHD